LPLSWSSPGLALILVDATLNNEFFSTGKGCNAPFELVRISATRRYSLVVVEARLWRPYFFDSWSNNPSQNAYKKQVQLKGRDQVMVSPIDN
jgi:hypothetical protein